MAILISKVSKITKVLEMNLIFGDIEVLLIKALLIIVYIP